MSGTSKLGSWESRKTTLVHRERLFSFDLHFVLTCRVSWLYKDRNIKDQYACLWYPRHPPFCPLNPVLLGQFQLGHRLPSNHTEANDHQHLVHLDLQAANHLSTLALALEQTASAMVPTNLLTCFIPDENL